MDGAAFMDLEKKSNRVQKTSCAFTRHGHQCEGVVRLDHALYAQTNDGRLVDRKCSLFKHVNVFQKIRRTLYVSLGTDFTLRPVKLLLPKRPPSAEIFTKEHRSVFENLNKSISRNRELER